MRPGLATLCAVATAAAPIGPVLAQETPQVLVARATTPQITGEVVREVAQTFKPTKLTGPLLAEAPGLTPEAVIERLCGAVTPAYYGEFEAQNGGRPRPRTTPIGAEARTLVFPACLRVASVNPAVQPTAPGADPFQLFVGETRTPLAMNRSAFIRFINSRVTFAASPVELEARPGRDLAAAAARLRSEGVAVTPVPVEEMTGYIVEGPDPEQIDAASTASQRCPAKAAPFDAGAVRAAYEWSLKRRSTTVAQPGVANLYVVDNGFFGANPYDPNVFSPSFPGRLFGAWAGTGSRVGPVTEFGPETIPPINYTSAGSVAIKPGVVAAHGTHVAGLSVGGSGFQTARDDLFLQTPGPDSFRLTIINIGKGERQLIRRSHTYLAGLLKQTADGAPPPPRRIVNLSIAYDGPQARGVFAGIFAEARETLFVVAAGNKATEVSAGRIFPAALGNRTNVLSVAAHDVGEPAQLSWFSNYGFNTVDIAGPGCGVTSWINMNETSEISGTSQAAPVASFLMGLLSTLDSSLSPFQLRARAMASGDLLGGGEQRWNVVSGSKLNLPEALLLFDDVVEVLPPSEARQPGDKPEIWIGDITDIWAMRCATDPVAYASGREKSMLWSVKIAEDGAHLFTNRDLDAYFRCAAGTAAPAAGAPTPFVRFVRRARLVGDKIIEDPAPQPAVELPYGRLHKVVFRGPYQGFP